MHASSCCTGVHTKSRATGFRSARLPLASVRKERPHVVVQKGQEFHESACISDLVAKKTYCDTSTDSSVLLWWDFVPHVSTPLWYFIGEERCSFCPGEKNFRPQATCTITWIISAARRCRCRQMRLALPPQPLGCVVGPFSRKQPLRVHVPGRSQWKEGKKKKNNNKKITCSLECSALLWVSGVGSV